ncbi:hypothetical protein GCM10025298_24990 [Natronobiforma cellulositropha]
MQTDTRVDVFEEIFIVFLALGTLVGVIVVAYTLYNAYKYRDVGADEDEDLPTLGELPTGGKGGRKLFVSFILSAIIVVSLVVWTYGMLLYVEDGPGDNPGDDAVEIDVEGQAFAWIFEYENGVESTNTMYVPADTPVWVNVTSTDVWHAFGIPEERVKADSIPGEYDLTWFIADLPDGEEEIVYEDGIECFELCGAGHSNMKGDLVVMEPDAFDEWLEEEAAALEEDEEDEDDEEGDA